MLSGTMWRCELNIQRQNPPGGIVRTCLAIQVGIFLMGQATRASNNSRHSHSPLRAIPSINDFFCSFRLDGEIGTALGKIIAAAMTIDAIEAEMSTIFAQTGTAEFVQQFPTRQKHPVNSTDLFENIASHPGELMTLVLEPAGFSGDNAMPADARLHFRRVRMAPVWI